MNQEYKLIITLCLALFIIVVFVILNEVGLVCFMEPRVKILTEPAQVIESSIKVSRTNDGGQISENFELQEVN